MSGVGQKTGKSGRVKPSEMQIVREPGEMQTIANRLRDAGMTIGFVPTMGYLHEGHLSLIRGAREESDITVLSIFVNPTQFGPDEDLDKYPRDIERDESMAKKEGVDYLFYPAPGTMYSPDFQTYVTVERVTRSHCGVSRPVHFRGVATVCTKLFNIVVPHRAYFGQKDYQQCVVIRTMARDLNMNLEIRVLPTVREADGLAMSSRNAYLEPEERKQAVCLYESLQLAEEMARAGERDARKIVSAVRDHIGARPAAQIDYVSIVNPDTLEEVEILDKEAVALLAVFFGKARLIDNAILKVR